MRSGASTRRTMADIAQLAGVSPSAVSFALNGRPGISPDTRARILQIAKEVDWFPSAAARALTSSRANSIGLVLTRSPREISVHPFHLSFIAGLDTALSSRGFSLLLHIASSEAEELLCYRQWHSEGRVDGVVLLDLLINDRRPDELRQLGLPALVLGDPSYVTGLPAVWSDDRAAVRDAVARLVQLGHSRLARVSERPSVAHAAVRNAAFVDACVEHGASAPQIRYAEGTNADEVTRALLSQPLGLAPTAVLYDSDVAAVSGLRAARQMNISVPDDLSIVAYDDSLLCEVSDPPLSAISRDVYALGAHVAQALVAEIEGETLHTPQRDVTPVLVERGSTGQVPHMKVEAS